MGRKDEAHASQSQQAGAGCGDETGPESGLFQFVEVCWNGCFHGFNLLVFCCFVFPFPLGRKIVILRLNQAR